MDILLDKDVSNASNASAQVMTHVEVEKACVTPLLTLCTVFLVNVQWLVKLIVSRLQTYLCWCVCFIYWLSIKSEPDLPHCKSLERQTHKNIAVNQVCVGAEKHLKDAEQGAEATGLTDTGVYD